MPTGASPSQPDDEPTRAGKWRRQRRAKRQALKPPTQGWLERTGDFVSRTRGAILGDQLLLNIPELSLYGVRPAFGGLPANAQFDGGLYYEPPFLDAPGRHVHAQMLGSLNGYYGGEAALGSENGAYLYYGFARHHRKPQEEFYGVGPNSRREAESGFRLNETLVGGLFGRSLADKLLIGTHVSYRAHRFGPGTEAGVPQVADRFPGVAGVGTDANYVVMGSFLEYDTRNIPHAREYGQRFAPTNDRLRRLSLDATSGLYLSSQVAHHVDIGRNQFSFTRLSLDLQEYVSIDEGTQHGLAFRQFVSLTHTAQDQAVPFYRLQSLGGSESLRGYRLGRFRDYNVLLLNAEVRCQVWHWLDMAVFGDAGHVFRRFRDLGPATVRADIGVGFRLRTSKGTAARLEFARGTEGVHVQLKLGSLL